MITDEKLEDLLKNERKRVFWRLNIIPWLTLTLTLIVIIIIVYKHPVNNKGIIENKGWITNNETPVYCSSNFINGINELNIETETAKRFYKEAVKNGYGEWKCNEEGVVKFYWKPCTESLISNQVEIRVNNEINNLRDKYKKNAIEVLESDRKKTYTECYRNFCIEAVSNGVARWIPTIDGYTEFKWKSISDIYLDYTSTESSKLIEKGMIKREYGFTESNYELAKKIGMDIEGELIRRCGIGIEGAFWGEDVRLKEKVRNEVNKSIHGIFDGFETLNRNEKKLGVK